MAGRLEGKVAIVTGTAQGIGRATAEVFAREGAKVVIADINEAAAGKTAAKLRERGADSAHVGVDVSSAEACRAMVVTALERFGRIDILCPNAGIYPMSPLEAMAEDEWDRVIAVNLKGVFLSIQACLGHMIAQSYGRIAVTSSTTGPKTAIPGLAHYAASKGGINGLVRTAAVELAKHHITVNGVEPGPILSDGVAALLDQKTLDEIAAPVPMGKLGDPEDVAHVLLFFASDEAKYVTGQTLVVDGGCILPEFLTQTG